MRQNHQLKIALPSRYIFNHLQGVSDGARAAKTTQRRFSSAYSSAVRASRVNQNSSPRSDSARMLGTFLAAVPVRRMVQRHQQPLLPPFSSRAERGAAQQARELIYGQRQQALLRAAHRARRCRRSGEG